MTADKRHPDRIWAASEGGAKWYYGYWDLGGQSDLNNRREYVRADLYDAAIARAEAAGAEVERLRTQLARIELSTDSREQGAIATAALAVSRAALRQDEAARVRIVTVPSAPNLWYAYSPERPDMHAIYGRTEEQARDLFLDALRQNGGGDE